MEIPDMCTDQRCLIRSGSHSDHSGHPCDGLLQTHVGTTDIPVPVKYNTDRMKQLVR